MDRSFLDVDGLFLTSNTTLTQAELEGNAIAAAQRAGVQHVVKLSAIGAGPESPVQTLRLHAAVEEELRRAELAGHRARSSGHLRSRSCRGRAG